jgi:hypothetical protein
MDSTIDWPPGALATFWAAAIAGAVALLSGVAGLVDGAVSRRRLAASTERDQWWLRFSFAIERANGSDLAERLLGLNMLIALMGISGLDEDDGALSRSVGACVPVLVVALLHAEAEGSDERA